MLTVPSPHMAVLLSALCAAAAVLTLDRPPTAVRRVHGLTAAQQRRDWRPLLEAARRRATAVGAVLMARRTRRANEERLRAAVISLCDGLAAELTAGRPPEAALAAALAVLDPDTISRHPSDPSPAGPGQATPGPRLSGPRLSGQSGPAYGVPGHEVLAHQRVIHEPAEFLEAEAARPGAEGLRLLAACWRIGAERGGTFASVIDGLATALRDEAAHREEVAGQLAGPRATARLLAFLPLLGLAMAAALGAHPVGFLLGTWPGLICLVLGVALDAVGLTWTRHIAEAAQQAR